MAIAAVVVSDEGMILKPGILEWPPCPIPYPPHPSDPQVCKGLGQRRRIWLTRHGESEYNTMGKIGGNSGLSLRYGERKVLGVFQQGKSRLCGWGVTP